MLVPPVTHTSPALGVASIEIPPTIKQSLGLDADRSWVVLAEPDLRTVPNDDENSIAHGVLSRGFFARVGNEFVATVDAGRAIRVPRTV